jgi:ABC-type dipeptide/oligopeptide/nickel transport system permease subunit
MSDLSERLGSGAQQRGIIASYIVGNTIASIGMLLVALLATLAVAGPWIVPHDPLEQSFLSASQGMSAEHWFGTDPFGRDVFSRVLLGTQASLAIGVTAPVLAALCGTWAGMLAGYFGGWTDRLLSRFADLLMSFPSLMLGIMILRPSDQAFAPPSSPSPLRCSRASFVSPGPRHRWCGASRSSTPRSLRAGARSRSWRATSCRTSPVRS